MQKRVRVRRDRPSAVSWAFALAVTMLAVYLITLSAPTAEPEAEETGSAAVRVARELTLSGVTVHAVSLGEYADAGEARIAAAGFAGQGAAGLILSRADGWHIIGACYESESDADRIVRRLSEEGIPAATLTLSAEAVALRVTASERDADAIAEGDRALRAALSQAGTLALQVDRGEITASQARTLSAVARSELDQARGCLSEVAGAQDQPVCAGLLALMQDVCEGFDGICQCASTGAALSGQLRCVRADGLVRLIGFLNELKSP